MFEWLTRRRDAAPAVFRREPAPARSARANAGPYLLLGVYLETRFADTIVLTFAEIEDILGFLLPAQARMHTDWWTADAPARSPHHSDSWTFAGRTAAPNLSALIVAFARAA